MDNLDLTGLGVVVVVEPMSSAKIELRMRKEAYYQIERYLDETQI